MNIKFSKYHYVIKNKFQIFILQKSSKLQLINLNSNTGVSFIVSSQSCILSKIRSEFDTSMVW